MLNTFLAILLVTCLAFLAARQRACRKMLLRAAIGCASIFLFAAPASAAITFTLNTGNASTKTQKLLIDSNNCTSAGPKSAFVGGIISNNGSTAVTGITATMLGLNSDIFFAGGQTATQSLGTLGAGESIGVYWFVGYSCTEAATATPTVNLSSSLGSQTATVNLQIYKAISANAGGLVNSATLGAGAVVGQTITFDTTYSFGGASANDEYFLQPAGNQSFNASCFRLVGASITASIVTAIPSGSTNKLYFQAATSQSGTNKTATVRYFFQYLCANQTTTTDPYAAQTSGNTNIKYTGNYGSVTISYPGATNPFTITKTVSPASGAVGSSSGPLTYTVTIANPSAFGTIIDRIDDQLPAGMSYIGLASGSDVTTSNSGSVPASGATGALSFHGKLGVSYVLAPSSSIKLVYTVNAPTTAGTFTNTAQAFIGTANTPTASSSFALVPPVNPVTESGSATAGTASTAIANVRSNDTVNGVAATATNSTIAQSGTWPAGITLDTSTGAVSVAATVAPGTYSITYQLCDLASPTPNCATVVDNVTVAAAIAPTGNVQGTVYGDTNGNHSLDSGEPRLAGWIVELVQDGRIIGSTTTDAQGNYAFTGLASGGYTVLLRNPQTNVVYGEIAGLTLGTGTTVADQNLPIDPSGVLYDSVSRQPVGGSTVTLVDAGNNVLPTSCFLDPSQRNQVVGADGRYRFDIVPGAAAQCPAGETLYRIAVTPPAGYSFASTVLLAQSTALDPTGQASPFRVSTSTDVPSDAAPVYYLSFRLASGDPHVINNHIPLDPFLTRAALLVTKTSTRRSASTGDLVPYEITVRNTENAQRAGVEVVDVLPAGMKYVPGSAMIDGTQLEPVTANGNRELVWRGQIIPANGSVRYSLTLTVGAGVTTGTTVNTGLARNSANSTPVSNRGTATVTIVPSSLFDCSELLGKVFEDRNRNGYQDEGEPGLPAARLATVNGQLVTSDEHGRYHIACAAVPDARIGSNFVLKLDPRSIPLGWELTTDNPRSIRLTRGKFGELNFGVAPPAFRDSPTTRQGKGE